MRLLWSALVVLLTIPFWQTAIEQTTAWRLSRRLGSPDETVRRASADGLVQLGPAASPWVIRAMRDRDARIRIVACSLVVRTAPEAGTIPLAALEAAVADADPSVRVAAVGQLEALISRYGSPDNSSVRDRARTHTLRRFRTYRRRSARLPAGPCSTSVPTPGPRCPRRSNSGRRRQIAAGDRRRGALSDRPGGLAPASGRRHGARCSPIKRSGSATGASFISWCVRRARTQRSPCSFR